MSPKRITYRLNCRYATSLSVIVYTACQRVGSILMFTLAMNHGETEQVFHELLVLCVSVLRVFKVNLPYGLCPIPDTLLFPLRRRCPIRRDIEIFIVSFFKKSLYIVLITLTALI